MLERTFTIVKPDGVERGLTGDILKMYEEAGLKIVAMKRIRLNQTQAEGFYHVHKEREFFPSLIEYMISGPVVVVVLEGEDAISKLRELMGATDPAKADAGTIRAKYGVNVQNNTVHGSDAPETAAFEIAYFFSALEIF